MIDQLISLQDTIREFMLKTKIPEIEWANLRMLGIRAYQDLCYDVLPNSRIIKELYIDSNAMIDSSDIQDLVELNAVYVKGGDGLLHPLSKNNKITPTLTAGDRNPDYNEGLDIPNPGGAYFSSVGGVNIEGYYVFDEVNRRILFTNIDPNSEVVLDYLSTAVNSSNFYIPSHITGAIHAYIGYKYYLYNENRGMALMFKEELRSEKARLRTIKFNIQDYKDWVLRTINPLILR
jgi:hypothetical protein